MKGDEEAGSSSLIAKKSSIGVQFEPELALTVLVEFPFKDSLQLLNSNPLLGLAVHFEPDVTYKKWLIGASKSPQVCVTNYAA